MYDETCLLKTECRVNNSGKKTQNCEILARSNNTGKQEDLLQNSISEGAARLQATTLFVCFYYVSFCDPVYYKKAVLPQGNRAMPQVFFSVEVRQQHSLQV